MNPCFASRIPGVPGARRAWTRYSVQQSDTSNRANLTNLKSVRIPKAVS